MNLDEIKARANAATPGKWDTDDYGTRRFRHRGWEVTKHAGFIGVDVAAPDMGRAVVEVSADQDGLTVFGEEGYRDGGYAGVRFTIPWPVVRALLEEGP
jgi:hypothetical protein